MALQLQRFWTSHVREAWLDTADLLLIFQLDYQGFSHQRDSYLHG